MVTHRICILLAENNVLIRNFLGTVLNTRGHLVLAAANHAEALELSRTYEGEIRLLIANSRELAEEIVAARPRTRVILLSARTSSDLQEIVRTAALGESLQQAPLPPGLGDWIGRALADPDFADSMGEV